MGRFLPKGEVSENNPILLSGESANAFAGEMENG
jgi:hypothetical protein